jgi:Fic family protein
VTTPHPTSPHIRSAHSSTAIEGNPLSLEEVSALAAGRDIMVRRKDRQEVLSYLEALKGVPEFAQRKPFTPKDLLEVHSAASGRNQRQIRFATDVHGLTRMENK